MCEIIPLINLNHHVDPGTVWLQMFVPVCAVLQSSLWKLVPLHLIYWDGATFIQLTQWHTWMEWTRVGYDMKHLMMRMNVNDFYHKLCKIMWFHLLSANCKCTLCRNVCEQYHFVICSKLKKSVLEFCKN